MMLETEDKRNIYSFVIAQGSATPSIHNLVLDYEYEYPVLVFINRPHGNACGVRIAKLKTSNFSLFKCCVTDLKAGRCAYSE